MKKLILLFLIILNIATVLAQKQNITFNHLTTDDGLSQFSVNSLYVDEQGVLWIGTREGLNRYNGSDIKTFKLQKNNPNSLFCNTVLRITGDQYGRCCRIRSNHAEIYNASARERHQYLLQ